MKSFIKKTISILLAILMFTSACPTVAFASDTVTSGDWQYTIVSTTDTKKCIELTSYLGTDKDIEVPTELDGNTVVGLNNTFIRQKGITVTLPEGIKYIGNETFYYTTDLSVSLPSTIEVICERAFGYSTIKSINFNKGIKAILSEAFENATFTDNNITLPTTLKYLGYNVFNLSNITGLYIPSQTQVVDISYKYSSGYTIVANENEFQLGKCENLQTFEIAENNPYYVAKDKVVFSLDMTSLLYCGINDYSDYTLPQSVDYIAPFAFQNAKINNFTLNSTISTLGEDSFREAAYIGQFNFNNNNAVTVIEASAFADSAIQGKIAFPAELETIEKWAFSGSQIESVTFQTPSNCSTICEQVFEDCTNLKSVFIPNSVTKLGFLEDETSDEVYNNYYADTFINDTALQTVTFEDNSRLTFLPYATFDGCTALTEINFGKNSALQKIQCSFSDTMIETIDFSQCKNLYDISGSNPHI